MDYVRKFLHVEGVIGQGAFGRVYLTTRRIETITPSPAPVSTTQQQQPQPQQQQSPATTTTTNTSGIVLSGTSADNTNDNNNETGHQKLQIECTNSLLSLSLSSSPLNQDRTLLGNSSFTSTTTNSASNGSPPRTKCTINDPNQRFALKCVHPILRPHKLANELRHLRDLEGLSNCVRMHTAHFNQGSLYIVMDLIEHDRFNDIVAQLDYEEIVIYMKNLLIALRHVHSKNIMHRDIKPGNFLFNRKNRQFLLVDFGLAQVSKFSAAAAFKAGSIKRQLQGDFTNQPKKMRFSLMNSDTKDTIKYTVGSYESPITNNESPRRSRPKFHVPETPRRDPRPRCNCYGLPRTCTRCQSRRDAGAPKSGTPGFKAPEVLLRCHNQTTAIDIWSAGVLFACLLSGHSPFFRDVEDTVSLGEIITIFGTQKMAHVAEVLSVKLTAKPVREPVSLKDLCKTIRYTNKETKAQIDFPDSAYDLLGKMLDPNPNTRITACEALNHPWLN